MILDSYQIAIDCRGNPDCTNDVSNSVVPPLPAIPNYPQIDCSGSTSNCKNTLLDVDVFSLKCDSVISCTAVLTGVTATTQIDLAGT